MAAEEEESKSLKYFDDNEDDDVQVDGKQKMSRKRVGPHVDADLDRAEVFVNFSIVFYDVTIRIRAFHELVTIEGKIDELLISLKCAL